MDTNKDLKAYEAIITESNKAWIARGGALYEIGSQGLWIADHGEGTFEDYFIGQWDIDKATASFEMRGYKLIEFMESYGYKVLPTNIGQIRELVSMVTLDFSDKQAPCKIAESSVIKVWDYVIASGLKPTAKVIKELKLKRIEEIEEKLAAQTELNKPDKQEPTEAKKGHGKPPEPPKEDAPTDTVQAELYADLTEQFKRERAKVATLNSKLDYFFEYFAEHDIEIPEELFNC
jgi:hypothetical protein